MLSKLSKKAFSLIELSIVVLVIGILIAGITSGSKLYSKFKLQTAQALTRSSAVNGIRDLAVWYETSLDESFISGQNVNNASISTWRDINPQRPIKNNATQLTPANQPIYLEDDLNGVPALNFDGSTDFMSFDGSTFVRTGYTIFAVVRRINTSNWNFIIAGDSCSTNQNLILGYADQTAQAWLSHCGNDLGYSIGSYSQPVSHVLTGWFSPAVGKRLRVNGAGPTSQSNLNSVTGSVNTLRIGRFLGSTFYRGKIYEIIMFNRALTDEERLSVEKYLGQKYAIKMRVS